MTEGASEAASTPVVRLEGLHKAYRLGFAWGKRVHAVRGLDLRVEPGEVLGFLGPNGAGKTTTLKLLLGLIRPTAGRAEVLGHPAGDPLARRRVGFLPENPYFYTYLRGHEFVELCGRLHGLSRSDARRSAADLLARVGLAGKEDLPLRRYSKGMLQRAGLAQALIGDPELVVLDEPQSGLDPVGRRQVRDLIRELKSEGRTVFFSSHVLADVELVCDRVALLVGGRLRSAGALDELLAPRVLTVDVTLEGDPSDLELPDQLAADVHELKREERLTYFQAQGEEAGDALVRAAVLGGLRIARAVPHRETLEDVFVREAADGGEDAA